MHSFTKNFLENVRKMFFSSACSSTDTNSRLVTSSTGVIPPINAQYRYLFYGGYNTSASALPSNAYHGIILGTGSPVRSADMIALGAPLNSSYLEYVNPPGYQVETSSHNTVSGGNITLYKSYKNITADTISVTEIGFTHYYSSNSYILFSHDTYSTPVTLAPD
jgi:hypothetical protein